jgi:hypothetical protein
MKNRSRITPYLLAILGTVLITAFGCSDELFDQNTGDRITPDQHYKTERDALASVNGAIIPLQEVLPGFIMLDGLRSDMMVPTDKADWYFREVSNHDPISPNNPLVDPSAYYKAIININETLSHIDSVVVSDKEFNDLTTFAYKGALVSMRSWIYLQLVRLYGEAVYIEDNCAYLPEYQTVMNKSDMIEVLISEVKPYVHEESDFSAREEYRIEMFTNAKAILGELYLEKDDYLNAVTYLKLACESYLTTNGNFLRVDKTYNIIVGKQTWSEIFLNAIDETIENVSVIPYSAREGQINPLGNWLGRNAPVAKASPVLLDSFMVQTTMAGALGDVYRGQGVTFEVDKVNAINDSTFSYEAKITKYAVDVNEPASTDIIISRAADIHLLLAEAYNRLGDIDSRKKALMLLNSGVVGVTPTSDRPADYKGKWADNRGVRGRVALKPRFVPSTITDSTEIMLAIEDMIIAERALELAFEGKRWNDLVRVAQRRGDISYLADKVAAKYGALGSAEYEAMHAKLMGLSLNTPGEGVYLKLQN